MDQVSKQNIISEGKNIGLNVNENGWEDDFLSNDSLERSSFQSTLAPVTLQAVPEFISSSPTTVTTIIIVALGIIVAIAVLFLLAFFIDYRQQKISERQQQCIIKKRKSLRLRLPRCRRIRQPTGIVEDAEETGQSRPPLETISEIV